MTGTVGGLSERLLQVGYTSSEGLRAGRSTPVLGARGCMRTHSVQSSAPDPTGAVRRAEIAALKDNPMTLAAAPPPDAPRTDEDLLALVAEGNHDAFAVFYDRICGRVFGLIKRVLVDPAQSEEVTQDVFLEIWQTASRFDPTRGKAASWALTMAHRRAIDRVRSSQSSRDRDLTVGIRNFEGSVDDVAGTAEAQLEHRRVRAAMGQLTPYQREALELTYFEGLTNTEAAVRAGVPLGTMKTRLRDSLIALRKLVVNAA
ncbi:RNA polymerase sigma factor (sigma-70 family) [Frondihabitans sp. PhB188]|nr:RNA polymerase sigma factor (sigma-70 family) [Frondihabitans sp. PhB188]